MIVISGRNLALNLNLQRAMKIPIKIINSIIKATNFFHPFSFFLNEYIKYFYGVCTTWIKIYQLKFLMSRIRLIELD